MQTNNAIRVVAAFEALKGFLALAAASGFLLLLHKDLHELTVRLVEHAHLNPAAHYPNIFIVAMTNLQNTKLSLIALGAVAYSTFRFVEAYGLFREAAWAKVMAAASGVIYLPFEVAEIIHRVSWFSVGAFVINIAVVFVMVYALLHKNKSGVENKAMKNTDSRVTIHMAASLDGFIARKDGRVDWMETADEYAGGETLDPDYAAAFLKTIDCYVMGSHTYETALGFEAKGFGWVYGDKPVFVLTSRALPRTRDTVEFCSVDLAQFVNGRLRPRFRNIWFVGGGVVAGECLRLGLADLVRYSILPVLIGEGIRFFGQLDQDLALHLTEVKAYKSGMVALCYEVKAQ